jgi:thymidylate kinase
MRLENDAWMEKLEKSAEAPDLLISDRGWLSHLAYTDHNVSTEFTNALYNGLVKKITKLPDMVLYFRVNTETALKRRIKRGEGMDVIEMKGVEFQEKVRGSFEKYSEELINQDNKLVIDIDANQDLDGVKQQLDAALDYLAANVEKRKRA